MNNTYRPALIFWFAVLTGRDHAFLPGRSLGGLVTSAMKPRHVRTGLAHELRLQHVRDYPPIKFWKGGALYEHTHRLWASFLGLLVVILTRWLGGGPSRLPLIHGRRS